MLRQPRWPLLLPQSWDAKSIIVNSIRYSTFDYGNKLNSEMSANNLGAPTKFYPNSKMALFGKTRKLYVFDKLISLVHIIVIEQCFGKLWHQYLCNGWIHKKDLNRKAGRPQSLAINLLILLLLLEKLQVTRNMILYICKVSC